MGISMFPTCKDCCRKKAPCCDLGGNNIQINIPGTGVVEFGGGGFMLNGKIIFSATPSDTGWILTLRQIEGVCTFILEKETFKFSLPAAGAACCPENGTPMTQLGDTLGGYLPIFACYEDDSYMTDCCVKHQVSHWDGSSLSPFHLDVVLDAALSGDNIIIPDFLQGTYVLDYDGAGLTSCDDYNPGDVVTVHYWKGVFVDVVPEDMIVYYWENVGDPTGAGYPASADYNQIDVVGTATVRTTVGGPCQLILCFGMYVIDTANNKILLRAEGTADQYGFTGASAFTSPSISTPVDLTIVNSMTPFASECTKQVLIDSEGYGCDAPCVGTSSPWSVSTWDLSGSL